MSDNFRHRPIEARENSLDCITMSAPLDATGLLLIGFREEGAGVRFVRGTARYRTWRAHESVVHLMGHPAPSREGVRRNNQVEVLIEEMFGSD
jgi:hypothetical protein